MGLSRQAIVCIALYAPLRTIVLTEHRRVACPLVLEHETGSRLDLLQPLQLEHVTFY